MKAMLFAILIIGAPSASWADGICESMFAPSSAKSVLALQTAKSFFKTDDIVLWQYALVEMSLPLFEASRPELTRKGATVEAFINKNIALRDKLPGILRTTLALSARERKVYADYVRDFGSYPLEAVMGVVEFERISNKLVTPTYGSIGEQMVAHLLEASRRNAKVGDVLKTFKRDAKGRSVPSIELTKGQGDLEIDVIDIRRYERTEPWHLQINLANRNSYSVPSEFGGRNIETSDWAYRAEERHIVWNEVKFGFSHAMLDGYSGQKIYKQAEKIYAVRMALKAAHLYVPKQSIFLIYPYVDPQLVNALTALDIEVIVVDPTRPIVASAIK